MSSSGNHAMAKTKKQTKHAAKHASPKTGPGTERLLAINVVPAMALAAVFVPTHTHTHTPVQDVRTMSDVTNTLHTGTPTTTSATTRHQPQHYTVRRGDTLSSIAGHLYGNSKDWPWLWWENRHRDRNPNELGAGLVLRLPNRYHPDPPAWLEHRASNAIPAPAPVAAAPAPASGPVSAPASYTASGPWPGGAFGACVVARESGGNPQIMNSTGHYGLYQFAESTWIKYGGAAADFGHASVAEQEQVFMNALAAGGQDNWAPYDGC